MITENKDKESYFCETLCSYTLPRNISLSLSNLWVNLPVQESAIYTGNITISFMIKIEGSSVMMPSIHIPNGLSIKSTHTVFSYFPDYISFKSETRAQASFLHIEINPQDFIEIFGEDLICSQNILNNKVIYQVLETTNQQLLGLNCLIQMMFNCAKNQHTSKIDRIAMEGYLLTYLIDSIKETDKYLSSRRKNTTDNYAHIITQRIKDQIMADLSNPPSLIEIAKEENICVSTLQNYCKKILGTTLFNFYQQERMRYAYECITHKKMSVTETALEVGYSNFSHFSAAFNKQFGFNPSKISPWLNLHYLK